MCDDFWDSARAGADRRCIGGEQIRHHLESRAIAQGGTSRACDLPREEHADDGSGKTIVPLRELLSGEDIDTQNQRGKKYFGEGDVAGVVIDGCQEEGEAQRRARKYAASGRDG